MVRGLIENLYKRMIRKVERKGLGVKERSGIKGFVLRLMWVGGKWMMRGRE